MIKGRTEGLSKKILEELDYLSELKVPTDQFISQEIIDILSLISLKINREISIYIDRRGNLLDISVGDLDRVSLEHMTLRRSADRLSGIRCFHTHPGGSGMLSRVDIDALKNLKLDAMTALAIGDGGFKEAYVGFLEPLADEGVKLYGPLDRDSLSSRELMDEIMELDKKISHDKFTNNYDDSEDRAILVGLDSGDDELSPLAELEELARTAGAITIDKVIQNRRNPDPASYIGRGKAEEISLMAKAQGANLVIFDDELTGSQMRNLEDIIGCRIIDRSSLILDIFAQRAISREGKLQVELAQLKYRLPRLMGMGLVLSRLGGGIGTRGPGEQQLETDRRHIGRRIREIEKELERVKSKRQTHRDRRERNALPLVAIVGYTNAGKSTLINVLSDSNQMVENKLFATLDPVYRGLSLENGQDILLVDTVGFIDKLPHDLVEAFKSTLEEAVYADVLLHVVDASNPNMYKQIEIVEAILDSLGAKQAIITVYNKMDRDSYDSMTLPAKKPFVSISAAKGQNLDELMELIIETLPVKRKTIEVILPYSEGQLTSLIHEQGLVHEENYMGEGIKMLAEVDTILYNRLAKYRI